MTEELHKLQQEILAIRERVLDLAEERTGGRELLHASGYLRQAAELVEQVIVRRRS